MESKSEELTTEDKSFVVEIPNKQSSNNSLDAEKTKRMKGRKKQKLAEEDQMIGQRSTSGFSSEESCNGKPRASRGSATDPQSLYARKRRERINERLRMLQKLVPNGTKVDISTMLEEAVQYVKFLQLQIKLLSSDDLWMFAPIAYNGIDIGLNVKLMKEDHGSQ